MKGLIQLLGQNESTRIHLYRSMVMSHQKFHVHAYEASKCSTWYRVKFVAL